MMKMDDVNHHRIKTNRIWMHIAEKKGQGPFVLCLHGFPETWWRHQITHLASHGYHVVTPDLVATANRTPPSPTSYTMFHIVGDLISLLDHFNQQQLFVVGHDWGITAAWHLSLFRPDRVKGMVAISVPFLSRDPNIKPSKNFYTRLDLHKGIQEARKAERAFAKYYYLTVMNKFVSISKTDLLIPPPRMEFIDYLETPSTLPLWITEEELRVYQTSFRSLDSPGG